MLNNANTEEIKLTTSNRPMDFSGPQTIPGENIPAAESPKERSFLNTVGEVWRGERSLTETWWIWKVLVGTLGIGVGLGFLAGLLTSITHSSLPLYLLLAISLPYDIWIWVGCMRCAWARQGFWGWVVIILCIVGLATAFSSIPTWVRLLTVYG